MYDDNEYDYKREHDAVNSTQPGQYKQSAQSGQPVSPAQNAPFMPLYPKYEPPERPAQHSPSVPYSQTVPPTQNTPFGPLYQQNTQPMPPEQPTPHLPPVPPAQNAPFGPQYPQYTQSLPSGQAAQHTPPVPPAQNTPYAPQYPQYPQYARPVQPARPIPPAQSALYRPQYAQYAPSAQPTPQLPERKRMGAGKMALLVIVCMILAAAAGFAGGYIATINSPGRSSSYTAQETKQPDIGPGSPSEGAAPVLEGVPPPSDPFVFSTLANNKDQDMTVPEVAAIVRPSVVEIKTETVTSGGWTGTYVSEGAGSGVIISADGYIITNDHVITGASSITVRLVDGREFPASLIATDSRTDIAVIKISASDLPPAVIGDSSALVVGEGTLAVGNPLGELGGTVTGGIISALDREMIVEGEAMTLLQTDAAVNPGNSGGGLFNMHAELIGIVNSKSSGLNIEGLGFAIPSNIAREAASDLIAYGYVRGRVDTGLELVDIQSTQAARWYRVSQIGLYILSSADEQLRNGDRITAVDGTAVTNLYDFNVAMKNHDIGSSVTISVARGNDTVSAVIVLKEWQP